MARVRQSNQIGSRDARQRLRLRAEPYWHVIERGLSLGYRKTAEGGAWIVRRYDPARRRHGESRIATADDNRDADGAEVLNFGQAQRKVLSESQERALKASGKLYTVAEAVADYLDFMRSHRKTAASTQAKLKTYVLPKEAKLGERRVADLTPADFDKWLMWALKRRKRAKKAAEPTSKKSQDEADVKRRRKATINRVINSLKACLNHAHKNGKVASDEAWRRLHKFRSVDSARQRWLSVDETRRLQNGSAADFRPIVSAALLTGCRQGELLALKARDFETESKSLLIADSKSGKPRRVFLNADGVAMFETLTAGKAEGDALFARADGTPWYPVALQRAMEAACKAGNVPAVKFHELRHTFASHLAQLGEPLLNIAALLGHSDTRMVEKHYGHLAPSHLHGTVAKLPSFVVLPTSNVEKLKQPKKRARK